MVAKSLVKGEWNTIPIEVMNPSSQVVILYHGTQAATIQPVSLVGDVQPMSIEKPERECQKTKYARKVTSLKFNPEIETLCQGIEYPLSEKEIREVQHLLWQKSRCVQN